ncbi:MAG: VOC family protein [Solirubrobacteraceae bacterium]
MSTTVPTSILSTGTWKIDSVHSSATFKVNTLSFSSTDLHAHGLFGGWRWFGFQRASLMAPRTTVDRIARYTPTMITRLDFIGIPSQDADRARSFYRDTLGLRPDEHGQYEQWAGDTCFGIWEPEKMGMPFVAQKGNPWAQGCDDVAAARAELEAKGVEFVGDTFDTGVCHMAFFSDPDGNDLMLHHRYAPYV